MIVLDCEQGSIAWHEARLGRPTASQFSRIVTPGGALSKSARRYQAELLAEQFLGPQEDEFAGSEWVERGKKLEGKARAFYAFDRDAEVTPVGFCYRDEQRDVGASPDGLVGDDGCLEVKVPMPKTHLLWLAEGILPREHVMQVQAQLWVTRRTWVDFLSFHPDLPELLIRVKPDPKLQWAFDDAIPAFIKDLAAGRERLLEMGVQPWTGYADADDPFGEGAGEPARVWKPGDGSHDSVLPSP